MRNVCKWWHGEGVYKYNCLWSNVSKQENINLAEKIFKSFKMYFHLENKVVYWETQSLGIKWHSPWQDKLLFKSSFQTNGISKGV